MFDEPGEIQIPQKTEMFIQFQADDKLSGNGGFNRNFGTYKITGSGIEFGQMGATRVACPELAMKLETLLFDTLAVAASFEIQEFQMTISGRSKTF